MAYFVPAPPTPPPSVDLTPITIGKLSPKELLAYARRLADWKDYLDACLVYRDRRHKEDWLRWTITGWVAAAAAVVGWIYSALGK